MIGLCGIVGFISLDGKDNAGEVLAQGLKKLEYRGYDSCGIAVMDGFRLIVRKDVGNIDSVAAKLNFSNERGTVGASHTRWATHGGVTPQNAHPHVDCTGKIAVVHNGIIENYQQLRSELQKKGHVFTSQTDTEVVPHLVEDEMKKGGGLEKACQRATDKLHGLNAFLIMSSAEPKKLIAVRNGSPLIIGVSKDALYAASDAVPFLDRTRDAIILNDGEYAVLDAGAPAGGNARFADLKTGKTIDKQPTRIEWSAQSASKAGFDHFMLKEITEQPSAVRQALAQDDAKVQDFADELSKAKNVVIIGMGTARHAALVMRYALQKLAKKHFEVIMASEYSYFAEEADKNTLVLAISQSGETTDVLVPCRKAKAKGAKIFSIVNVVGSTLDRLSDNRLYINAGPEIAVASTKAFTNQVVVGMLVAYAMAGKLAQGKKKLAELPQKIELAIRSNDEVCKKLAQYLKHREHAYYIGRGINFATALEASLKMKEISYVHAEGMPAGELKHGTLALVEKGTPVIAINPPDYTFEETLGNAIETKARGAKVIGVSTKNNEAYDEFISVPVADDLLYPLLCVVPLQLLAYYAAVARGNEVDRPRNLAKSVTVK